MKKLILITSILISIAAQGQEYSFISDSLKLLPMEELAKKQPPVDFEPVYYEDGTKESDEAKTIIELYKEFLNKT